MRFRSRGLTACVVALALLAAGCGGGDDDDDASDNASTAAGGGGQTTGTSATAAEDSVDGPAGEHGDTLTVATPVTPAQGMSASVAEFGSRTYYYQAVYDPLLRAEPDGTIAAWLATDWSYNDDNTVLTLTLRDDVTFTDGTPFNADAAAQNLIRFRDGSSPDASNLASMTDATAVDDTTLEITLSEPDPALLNYLARNAGMMQSPATFGASDEATNPVGSGPYTLNQGETVADSVYTYDANPDYWAPERIKFDKLVLRVLPDPTATLNAIRAGEVDAAALLTDAIPDVKAAGWTVQQQEMEWVGLTLVDRDGSMNSPLGDVKVRQAINQAFDREALLEGLETGQGTATTQVFRAESAGFDPALDDLYPYDPEAAKQLLADAGYPDGFSLSLPTLPALPEPFFATIRDQLGAIGIDVGYTDEGNEYFGAILTPKYPAYLMFLEQAPNDWQFVNFLLSEDAVWNPSHYGDATSKELITTIQTTDGDEQAAATKELGKYVTEQAWFAPWYRRKSAFATAPTVNVELQLGASPPYLFNFSPQG